MKTNSILNEEMQGQKLTNFLAGYVLALAALFVALEYSQREVNVIEDEPVFSSVIFEDDMIPVTLHQEELPAPPPAAAPTVAEILNVVDDIIDIPDPEIEIIGPDNPGVFGPGPGIVTDNPGILGPIGVPGPTVEPMDDEIILAPEIEAEFPGDVNKWLGEHVKYPFICQEKGIQGRVILSFVVEKNGSITDIQVVRSPSDDSNMDLSTEAIRVVQTMPNWKPARQGNKAVRSRFNLPILFRLN